MLRPARPIPRGCYPGGTPPTMNTAGEKFQRLVEIMARLRGPGGCPWDREQTFDTIKPYTLEETYEVLDAIDRARLARTRRGTRRLHAAGRLLRADGRANRTCSASRTRSTRSSRSWSAGIRTFSAKRSAETADDVKRIWGEVKAAEKKDKGKRDQTLLGGVPRALPALVEAQQIASRAAGVGFDWENPEQVIEKLHEELAEFDAGPPQRSAAGTGRRTGRFAVRPGEPRAFRQGGSGAGAAADQRQVSRALRVHRAEARRARQKSGRRRHIEEMEALWQEAKG